jgi:hypothetical protein
MGSPTTRELYLESLKLVLEILALRSDAELVSDIKSSIRLVLQRFFIRQSVGAHRRRCRVLH